VEALSHVINFDVPNSPEDYVHRVGRTGRVELTGDAFLFVSPEEEADVRRIERVLGARLPRITLSGFDYTKKPAEARDPLGQRLAAMRAQGPGRKVRPPAARSWGQRSFSR
jgi:ATP-dependent RNA helicase RhlE